MSDPLTDTLWVLPLTLAGLWLVERRVRDRHGTFISAIGNSLQAGTFGALLLAILARDHLGLITHVLARDALMIGGLIALLLVRVAHIVGALAKTPKTDGQLRPCWSFFVLPLLVYITILPWVGHQREPDGDEPYYLLIAHSLVHDFDTELTNNYAEEHSLFFSSRALEPEWADPVRADGRAFSRHSLVLPLVLAPGYALAGRWGAMLTMALIAAAVGWLALSLALRYWGAEHRGEAVWMWAVLAMTPPLIIYSYQIWVELPAALLMLLALHRIQDLKDPQGSSLRQWIFLGLILILLPVVKLRLVVISVSLLLLAGWRSGGSRRTVVWVGLTLVAAIGGILLFNLVVFDNPFKDHTLDQLLTIQGRSPTTYLRGMAGLFWDCAFGLFANNPIWLLLIPAFLLMLWRRSPILIDLLVCVVPYLAVISPRREWYGAWSPPFRFGMVLLPLLALTLVPLLKSRDRAGARGLLAALGLAGLALLLLWTVVPGWTYNLAVGTNHLIDHLSIRLAADVGRFLPSLARLRTATWAVPLVATALLLLSWWYPGRRPRSAVAWAAAAILIAAAALPVAAARVPTAIVEFEDRQVIKMGGELYPGAWEPFRPRFRGGWRLTEGEGVRVPVTETGRGFLVEIDLQPTGRSEEQLAIEIFAGDLDLGSWPLTRGNGWQTVSVEGAEWPAGAELTIRARREIVLDRARFAWK